MCVCVGVCWSAVWREGGPSLESHRLLTVDIFAEKGSFFFFFFFLLQNIHVSPAGHFVSRQSPPS